MKKHPARSKSKENHRNSLLKEPPFSDSEGIIGTDSHKLAYLISGYEERLRRAQGEALQDFWQDAERINKPWEDRLNNGFQWMTDEELNLLKEARDGNLKAIQSLIEGNPNILFLPFIADRVVDVLLKYKWSDDPTEKEEIRDRVWPEFLPKRTGGKDYFRKDDLGRELKSLMQAQKITKKKACEILSKRYSLNVDRLYRIEGIGKRGRPNKKMV